MRAKRMMAAALVLAFAISLAAAVRLAGDNAAPTMSARSTPANSCPASMTWDGVGCG